MSRVVGVPSSQVQSSTQTDWNGAVQARAGAGVEIVSWLAARVDVVGGVTMHRLVVAYADANNVSHDVAAWGRGYVAASLGLQAGW
jgi:hypothetical protein